MSKKEVLHALIDSKRVKVCKVVVHQTNEFYLSEIAKQANVSITTTFRILQDLTALGVLEKRTNKTAKLYSIINNPKFKHLKDLFYESFDALSFIKEKIAHNQEIHSAILQGSSKSGKANIIFIGTAITPKPLEELQSELKERKFDLSFMTLTKDQYEQMTQMGLYSGEKKVLK